MDTPSIALFVLLLPHVIGGVFLGWWILPDGAKAELRGWFRDDDGGVDPVPAPRDPDGGGQGSRLPLPDAAPAMVRMRESGSRLDGGSVPLRRPVHPVDPERRREQLPR